MPHAKAATPFARLGPPDEMAPPAVCRGATTGWPQLVRAIDSISGNPALAAELQMHFGSRTGTGFGSPTKLMAALAVNPAMLQGPKPPMEIFAQFVWYSAKVLDGARTMGATLAQFPALLSATTGLTPSQAGALVSEVIVGPAGLKQKADSLAVVADDFVQRLGEVTGKYDQALSGFKTAGTNLEQQAAAAAGINVKGPAEYQSAAEASARAVRNQLEAFELAAAAVTAAAVLQNLTLAIQALAAAWRKTSAGLEAAVASATPEQLGNLDYLRNTLELDRAAADWRTFADTVRSFIQRLPVARVSAAF